MSDVFVDVHEWRKLDQELCEIRKDARKVDAFMSKHANKKWDVSNVGLSIR